MPLCCYCVAVASNNVCHPECSEDGCWGPQDNDCLSCENYILKPEDICLANCTVAPG